MEQTPSIDEKIINLYFSRSEDAIAETDRQYGRYCRAVADSVLRCAEDTEECVNDTYLQTWNSIPPTKPFSLKAYLGKITRNLAIHRWEKATADKRGGGEVPLVLSELDECLSDRFTTEDSYAESILTDALNRFLGSISKEQRIIFLRRYWYNASIAQIAGDMGITEGKVKTVLHRLRAKLRTVLEKEGIL